MSPRRGAGEGHIRKVTLRSGRRAWRGWITIGYRANGTPIRRSVQRATRQAVQDALVTLRARYAVALDYEAETATRLHGLLADWLAHYTATQATKLRTPATYRWAVNHLTAATPANPLVAKLGTADLSAILSRLPETLSPSSLRLCRVALRGALTLAVERRIRPDNPAIGLKLPRRERVEPERRTVDQDEAAALLRALADERLGLAVALTYAVAIRPGEAVALRRQDIDLDAGTLTVSGTHSRVGRQPIAREAPKSKRGVRTLPIPEELRPWVARQIARAGNERALMGGQWTAPDEGLLFVRETDGGRLRSGAVYDCARRVAERIGLGTVGPRILRRSMLSLLAQAGVDAKVRAAIGGHTEAVTERHYREVDPGEVVEAMRRVKVEGVKGEPDD